MGRRLFSNDRGAILPMGLLFGIFSFALGYGVFALAQIVDHREQMQDRADTAAYAGAAVWAERMNDVSEFSVLQIQSVKALALAYTLRSVDYQCSPPNTGNFQPSCTPSRQPRAENLADGVTQETSPRGTQWSSVIGTREYSNAVLGLGPTSMSVQVKAALCSDAGCTQAVQNAANHGNQLPGRPSTTTLATTLDTAWTAAHTLAAGASGGEYAAGINTNNFQSPDQSQAPFSNSGGYGLVRCMGWSQVDPSYRKELIDEILPRANALIAVHNTEVVEPENSQAIGSAQTQTAQNQASANQNATQQANATYPPNAPVNAPCTGRLNLANPGCTNDCKVRLSCDGGGTISGITYTFGGGINAVTVGVPISRGQRIGIASPNGASRSGFSASAGTVTVVKPQASWQLRFRSTGDVRRALRQAWADLRNVGVCFPTISRNTNRYRFMGVAATTGSGTANNRIQQYAVVVAAGAPTETAGGNEYQFSDAGNFAWAQAGMGVIAAGNTSPEERQASAGTVSGGWYTLPVHEFGYRKWRPRMVRIEMHGSNNDEDQYGTTNWGSGPASAVGSNVERDVFKKVNDAFAH